MFLKVLPTDSIPLSALFRKWLIWKELSHLKSYPFPYAPTFNDWALHMYKGPAPFVHLETSLKGHPRLGMFPSAWSTGTVPRTLSNTLSACKSLLQSLPLGTPTCNNQLDSPKLVVGFLTLYDVIWQKPYHQGGAYVSLNKWWIAPLAAPRNQVSSSSLLPLYMSVVFISTREDGCSTSRHHFHVSRQEGWRVRSKRQRSMTLKSFKEVLSDDLGLCQNGSVCYPQVRGRLSRYFQWHTLWPCATLGL